MTNPPVLSALKNRIIDFWKNLDIPREGLFLLFVALNTAKLTLVQWFFTRSVYSLSYVVVKNLVFLYLVWRLFLFFRKRGPLMAGWILQSVYLTFYMGYYLYSGQILSINQIIYNAGSGAEIINSGIFLALNPLLYLAFIDIPAILLMMKVYQPLRKALKSTQILAVLAAALLTWQVFLLLGYFHPERILHDSLPRRMFKYGTLRSQLYDLSIDEEGYIADLDYGEPLRLPSRPDKHNLVTLQIESLNADIIGHRVGGQLVMPYLTRMARENITYPVMAAQHKTGNSSDAEFSVFNSLEAVEGFPAAQFTQYTYPNSFVKILSRAGYHCLAFHGNKGDFFNRYVNLEKMGFDYFYDRLRLDLPEIGWGAPDHLVYEKMLEKMSQEEGPFYYHHITMSSHGPFTAADNYFHSPLTADLPPGKQRNYLNSMAYVDQTLRDFITALQKDFPDTWIFIYGDHIVNSGGDSYPSRVWAHLGQTSFEIVPFVMIGPEGTPSHREETYAVSFLDVAPTALEVTGVGGTIRTSGESLLPPLAGDTPLLMNKKAFSRRELYQAYRKD